MRAIRLHEFGPAGNLVLDELPDLEPAPGQVRIAVEAAGVHLIDTTIRRGEPGTPLPPPELPTIPGREVAGVVDRVGAGVDQQWVGRRVAAHLGPVPGGYADQAVTAVGVADRSCPTTSASRTRSPPSAPAGPRWASWSSSRPDEDDVVWVPSAAGGLGWFLAQAAAESGPRWSPRAGGADRVARSRARAPTWSSTTRSRTGPTSARAHRRVTLVYDGVGGDVGPTGAGAAAPGGRLVMFGFSAGAPTRFDTDDVCSSGITAGWSLGPRMMAPAGRHHGAGRARPGPSGRRGVAAARDDVPACRGGPGARRPRAAPRAGQGRPGRAPMKAPMNSVAPVGLHSQTDVEESR